MNPDPDPAGTDEATVDVAVTDETADGLDRVDRWAAVARDTLRAEAIVGGRLDLVFVDTARIEALNREHLGGDGPTDVLAFPLDGPDVAQRAAASKGAPVHLGDVVICPEIARRQAPSHCGTFEAEMSLLIVHGVLHVLGHDHAEPDETRAMQERERVHLERHGYDHPVPA